MYVETRLDSALKYQKKFENLAATDDVEYTLEHRFYANMGAIKVNLPPQKARTLENRGNEMVGRGHTEHHPNISTPNEVSQSIKMLYLTMTQTLSK